MTNLDELYSTDSAFRDIVNEAAAAAIGTTNPEFAEEWLALPAGDADEPSLAAAYKAENESLREQNRRMALTIANMRELLEDDCR